MFMRKAVYLELCPGCPGFGGFRRCPQCDSLFVMSAKRCILQCNIFPLVFIKYAAKIFARSLLGESTGTNPCTVSPISAEHLRPGRGRSLIEVA